MANDLVSFKRNLSAMIERGDLALPSSVSPDLFRNAAIVAFQTNPQLRSATPESVFTALRHLAGSGLMPDGREAAVVIYGGKATAMPMVGGLRKIISQSGLVLDFWDDVVYDGEEIIFTFEDGRRLWKHINTDGSPLSALKRGGEIIGAYSAAKMRNGGIEIEVMSRAQIDKRRKASPNQKGKQNPTGVWSDWYEEMARKTVVRAIAKRLPMSTEDYNRIMADPNFMELETMKDVTPPETTEERLRRIARERAGGPADPDEGEKAAEGQDEAPDAPDGAEEASEGETIDGEVIPE